MNNLVALLLVFLSLLGRVQAQGDCVCEMQGRFVDGAFQMDFCDNGDCTFGISEGACVYRIKLDAMGNTVEWCDCSLSPGDWPTLCVCSGYVWGGPLPVVCWTEHASDFPKQCNTDHWWPLPAAWTPCCQCNL